MDKSLTCEHSPIVVLQCNVTCWQSGHLTRTCRVTAARSPKTLKKAHSPLMEMLALRRCRLFRHFPKCNPQRLHTHSIRYLSSPAAQPKPKPRLGTGAQTQHEQPPLPPQRPEQEKKQLHEYQQPLKRENTWLTRQIETSPTAKTLFNALATALGYSSPKQRAGRRAYVLYRNVCAVRPDEDKDFWQKGTFSLSPICLRHLSRRRFSSQQNATSHPHSNPGSP